MAFVPQQAMVLAAGLGTRMRPLDPALPKPLVPLAGRTLLDRVLDRIAEAGVPEAVVNVHFKADLIEEHLSRRATPHIVVSDERALLLETGGGVRLAHDRGLLGKGVFLVHNSDSVWLEAGVRNLVRLFEAWRDTEMDCLMLLADRARSLGYAGRGDFDLRADGRIARPIAETRESRVFAGVSMMHPRMLEGAPDGPFSLNRLWDRSLAAGRAFGIVLDGTWMHVGDPVAHADAEKLIAAQSP